MVALPIMVTFAVTAWASASTNNKRVEDLRGDINKRMEDLRGDSNKRMEDLRSDMNKRGEDLRNEMNHRFDESNRRVLEAREESNRRSDEAREESNRRFDEVIRRLARIEDLLANHDGLLVWKSVPRSSAATKNQPSPPDRPQSLRPPLR